MVVLFVTGVFSVGKIGGKNFIKSPTGWYLAIDSSGNVYMKVRYVNQTVSKFHCSQSYVKCFHSRSYSRDVSASAIHQSKPISINKNVFSLFRQCINLFSIVHKLYATANNFEGACGNSN